MLACITATALHAQNPRLTSSAEMDNRFIDSHGEQVLGADETGFYTIRVNGPITDSETIVERYDNSLKWAGSVKLPGSKGDVTNAKFHRQTLLLHGTVLTFHDRFSKADGTTYCSVIPMEVGGGELPEVVLDKEVAEGYFKTPTYTECLSPDGTKLAVMDEPVFTKGAMERIRVKVFDTDGFKEIWSRDMTLAYESDRNPENDIAVDNAGNAYIFKHVKLGPKEHVYELIVANKAGNKSHKLDLQTYFPTEYAMAWDNDGSLLISGMLAPQGQSATYWDRTWALKAGANGIVYNKVLPLGETLLRGQLSEKLAAAPTARLGDCKLKGVLARQSGGFYLVAEELRTTKTPVGQAQPPVYDYALDHGNVYLTSIGSDGAVLWTRVITKKQVEHTMDPDRYFGSIGCHVAGNDLCLVWNYMAWETMPGTSIRCWTDKSGAKIDIDNIFTKAAVHPTLLTVLREDGNMRFGEWTWASYPLGDLQKGNSFPMAFDRSLLFSTEKGMILLSRMNGLPWKKYKFTRLEL